MKCGKKKRELDENRMKEERKERPKRFSVLLQIAIFNITEAFCFFFLLFQVKTFLDQVFKYIL